MNKAVYHSRAGQLLWETDNTHSNGIVTIHQVKTKFIKTIPEAQKYANRYLKTHLFSIQEY